MSVTTIKNNKNNNQAFGTYDSNYGSNKALSCPAGSYITQVHGHAGADVDNITGITCRDVVTGDISQQSGQLGHSGGNGVDLLCNGTDGIVGFNVNTRASNQSGGEVNGLKAACRGIGDSSGNNTLTGCWGGGNCNGDTYTCPAGTYAVAVYGGQSNRQGYLNQFYWDCKPLTAMQGISGNNVARGKCLVGDDGSAECGDLKGSLQKLGSANADVRDYCKQGTNIATSQSCARRYNTDGSNTDYQDIMMGTGGYCQQGNNFNTDLCKQFCTADSGKGLPNSMKEKCNTLFMTQCQKPKNVSLPVCNSLQPWEAYPGASAINKIPAAPQEPMCYFSDVRAYGYKKAPLTDLSCPDCVQNQTISIVDASNTNLSNIKQTCNIDKSTGAASPTPAPEVKTVPPFDAVSANKADPTTSSANPSSTAVTAVPATVTATTQKSKTTVIVIIVVIVVVVCCMCSSSGLGAIALAK